MNVRGRVGWLILLITLIIVCVCLLANFPVPVVPLAIAGLIGAILAIAGY